MAGNSIKIEFLNEPNPEVFARFIENVISVNLKNNYSPEQQNELLNRFAIEGLIKG